MRNYKAVEVKEWVVDNVVCNKCGKKFDYDDLSPESQTHFFEIRHRFGERGKKITKFDLCEKCLWEFVLEFEIPPSTKDVS